jgi:hypothetical protein
LLNKFFSGSSVKKPSLKAPFMDFLTERCPVPRVLLYSSFKIPRIWAPLQIPLPLPLPLLKHDIIRTCGQRK